MAICPRYNTQSPGKSSNPTLQGRIASTPATTLPSSMPTVRETTTRRGTPNCSCRVRRPRPATSDIRAKLPRPRQHTTRKTLDDRNQLCLTTPLQGMLHPPRPPQRATLPSPRTTHLLHTIPRPTQVSLYPSASRLTKATIHLPTTTPIPVCLRLQPPRMASRPTLPTVQPTITETHPHKSFSHQVVTRSMGAASPVPANTRLIQHRL